jgi:hypothetical protein
VSILSRLQNRFLLVCAAFFTVLVPTELGHGQTRPEALVVVQKMIENEHQATFHKSPFSYVSVERSDRTGGHEWTERVVEVSDGKLRNLILEDGVPISMVRRRREDARLHAIEKDPDQFFRHEHAERSDEQRAQKILDLLPRAFLFEDNGLQQNWKSISYRPNTSYVPQSYEERILHGMSGTILIDPQNNRLHLLQGTLGNDVSFGYGLLATLRRGSTFSLVRSPILGDFWKTTQVDIQMNGQVVLFKTISRQQTSKHKDFTLLPSKLTIAQAVALLTR